MDGDGVRAHKDRLIVPRGEKTIFAGGRKVLVHTPRSRTVLLPTGEFVKVWVDDSGRVSQIEDMSDQLHAVVRPKTIDIRMNMQEGL